MLLDLDKPVTKAPVILPELLCVVSGRRTAPVDPPGVVRSLPRDADVYYFWPP